VRVSVSVVEETIVSTAVCVMVVGNVTVTSTVLVAESISVLDTTCVAVRVSVIESMSVCETVWTVVVVWSEVANTVTCFEIVEAIVLVRVTNASGADTVAVWITNEGECVTVRVVVVVGAGAMTVALVAKMQRQAEMYCAVFAHLFA
jgi:hypothetical protein